MKKKVNEKKKKEKWGDNTKLVLLNVTDYIKVNKNGVTRILPLCTISNNYSTIGLKRSTQAQEKHFHFFFYFYSEEILLLRRTKRHPYVNVILVWGGGVGIEISRHCQWR